MREIQREAWRQEAFLDSDEEQDDLPRTEAHIQMDEERAMNEVTLNYFEDNDMTYEEEHVQPRRGHPREKLWEAAKQHATTRIFEGARLSQLSTILELLNLQSKFNVSNIMIDCLLRSMHDLILPEGNTLPSSWKQAKKILRSIGMKYEIMHACPNDCILYRKQYADCIVCPECETPRYKANMATEKVPQKAMRYFPLIPRLLHTYRCSDLAEYQVWHANHRSEEGVMRMAVDSPANKFVEQKWPEFGGDPRNVRLGLATDGISPFNITGKAQPYSVWPVVLMNYNIPPWLSMKRGHLILSMIIPGPKQPSDMSVYLAPLIEELEKLWSGVSAYDNRKKTDGLPREFILKAVLLWTMHDYPGTIPTLNLRATRHDNA